MIRSISLSLFLPRVSVGTDMLFCREGCTAVIDTGSSYITGPAASITSLMKKIGASELAEGGVCTIMSVLYEVTATRKTDQHYHCKLFLTDSLGALVKTSPATI